MGRKSGDGDGKGGRKVFLIVAWEGILAKRVLGFWAHREKGGRA